MKDSIRVTHLILILLSSMLGACVVVPQKVASYDRQCMVSTQKIELTLEQAETFHSMDCSNDYCELDFAEDIAASALLFTSSAIVSGSIALAGNTLYWLESKGECPNVNPPAPATQPTETDEKYLIQEEIITARS